MLNASYEPLSVVTTRRAIVLVMRDRAEVIESNGMVWHSERMTMSSPSVVRLHNFVWVPRARRVPLNKRAIFLRDGNMCQYCSRPAENVDHVVPRSQGGEHVWENVVASCRRCNSKKGGRTPAEAGLQLRRLPRVPRRNSWVLAQSGSTVDPAWERYLAVG